MAEIPFQDTLKDLLRSVITKYKFYSIEFSKVERDYPIVDTRSPDLVLFLKLEDEPFLVIETKRRVEDHQRVRGLFEPLGKAAVGQAISYPALYYEKYHKLIPFFSTANPREIAVFKTPENILDFVNMDAIRRRRYEDVLKPGKLSELTSTYLVLHDEVELTEEFATRILDVLAEEYLGKIRVHKVSPGWAIITFLRNFVENLSGIIEPMIKLKYEEDREFKIMLMEEEKRLGFIPNVGSLARMMAYVLMNKIIFYKVLEEKYTRLPPLLALDTSSKDAFLKQLDSYFERAVTETGDFEPIFKTGIYDMLDLPDMLDALEYINEFIETISEYRAEEIGNYIGYIYEELIPPSERHQLGQFYTPPAICELISKWAIRSSNDLVLDPGCGSGGFLLAAYKELVKQKIGEVKIPPPRDVHEKVLSQLFGVDINPFPTHLTAMSISMKNVRSPSTGLNIIEWDFFLLEPQQRILSKYTVRTPAGEFRKEIVIPKVDAVIGNPPYTRWVEIPESTKNAIREKLGELIKKYGLTPQLSRGVEPGIYTYWIIHATKFLKNGGRLGMIISNLWMQTDYGIGFGQFLLDHYKIKAIIDFTLRLFSALISTCILLLEKEESKVERDENEVVFIHIPGTLEDVRVDDLLKVIEEGKSDKFYVRKIKQRELPRDEKWIKAFLGVEKLFEHPLMIKLSELFDPSYGNLTYLVLVSRGIIRGVRNPGASDFVYLSPSKARDFNLNEFSYPHVSLNEAIIYPAITSARDVTYFTFSEDDWMKLYREDKECYMFICHKPRNQLPSKIKRYVEWGEPVCPICHGELRRRGNDYFICDRGHRIPLVEKCITKIRETRGGGRFASETESARVRKESKEFYGWYDLGGVEYAPIFAIYQAWYKTRFVRCDFPVALYHALIALIPKVSLTREHLNALLAYLNSSFSQYYIETGGRRSGGGIIALEVNIARDMPILDIRRLSEDQVKALSESFEKLENEARKIGGASEKEQIDRLKPIIYEIDNVVAKILGLPDVMVKSVQMQVDMLVERRIAGSKEERRGHVKGEAELKVSPSKR
ncbi:MAG: N-6 DNA methylase, partial [Thermoproteota archaeon]